jgi:hypothetical protein
MIAVNRVSVAGRRRGAHVIHGMPIQSDLLQQLNRGRRVALMAHLQWRVRRFPGAESGQARQQQPHGSDSRLLRTRPVTNQRTLHRVRQSVEFAVDLPE